MKLRIYLLGLTALLFGGCIDSNFDLSDIDTNSEFKVEDLTLPVNIDVITLSDIFDIDDSSKIKVVNIDGSEYYAIVESGEFQPDPISVDSFSAAAPQIESTHQQIGSIDCNSQDSPAAISLVEDSKTFNFHFSGIPDAVYSASSVATDDTYLKISVDVSALASCTQQLYVKNLKIYIPKGLTATTDRGSYDKTSGLLTIDELPLPNGKGVVTIDITGIDFAANNAELDYDAHTLTMNSTIDLHSGTLIAAIKEDASLPAASNLYVNYDFSRLTATAFSGTVKYDIEGIKIDPITLSDIPEVLTHDNTELFISNPQIYLKMYNMVADYGLGYSANLRFTANRPGLPSLTYTPDVDSFYVGCDHGSGPYNFVLSPSLPASPLDGFSSALSFVPFSSLSDLIAGKDGCDGVPSSIDVEVVNPMIPLQQVKNFKLGVGYPSPKNEYEFFAPLSLKTGSIIVYSKSYDGWNDEDVDAITISKLTVRANVTSTLPLEADIVAYPIDKNGNVINNVQITGGYIPAEANNYELTLSASGVITHLDGVRLEARVKSGDEKTLAPQETITLTNIKATVSGSYTKEL